MPPDPGSTTGSRHGADLTTAFGLSKEDVRRIVLDKLRVVYHDWHFTEVPFADFLSDAGERPPCGLISRISVSGSLPNEIRLRRIDGWPKIAAVLSQHAKVAA